jgi:CheY-like chemotaxis protein
MRVLIVEDEPYLAEAIRDGLRLEAIAADIAGDGDTALELLSVNAYDIAVLDRDIPGPGGDEVANRIVASGSGMPILMLTAADGSTIRPPGSSLAPTTTSPSPSNSESSCSVSERSTAGVPTTGHPCERSQVCVWIRSAARSIATAATWR